MKKWLIGAGIAVAAIGLVVGGAAYAASRTAGAFARQAGAYASMPFMGGRMGPLQPNGTGERRFGGQLHELVFEAVAKGFGLSVEELRTNLADGQDLKEIAQAHGLTEDEMTTLLKEARASALAAAVEQGLLTQEQADWMADHPVMLRMLAGMHDGRGGPDGRGGMGWGRYGSW